MTEERYAVDQELGTKEEVKRVPIAMSKDQMEALMSRVRIFANGVNRSENPWDKIHLSKEARKGRTAEELQAMRRRIWARDNVQPSTIIPPILPQEEASE